MSWMFTRPTALELSFLRMGGRLSRSLLEACRFLGSAEQMKRANAYAALATEIERWRLKPAGELASRVGAPPAVRHAEVAGEVVSVEVSVAWADTSRSEFRIEAVANGPSYWTTERLVERITVVAQAS